MAFREFLSDRMGKTILEILIMTLTSVILFTTGTQSGVIALLIINLPDSHNIASRQLFYMPVTSE